MIDDTRFHHTEAAAHELDELDTLKSFRNEFYVPDGCLYMDGNSLGLASRRAEKSVLAALTDWKQKGIGGWLDANPPWFTLCEQLGERLAPLVGAQASEIVVTGSTTINLHQLLATFYHPTHDRSNIVADELSFPSDLYALKSQLALHGLTADTHLITVASRDGRTIDEADVERVLDEHVAVVILPSVLYRSGQLLDIERLAESVHRCGAYIGFDLSHSVGALPHQLDDWDVDFAFWCNYKYVNGGPGTTAAIYVNTRHRDRLPGLTGWWGNDKNTQFDMNATFQPAFGAGAYQLGTPPILSTSALAGSLELILEAGIHAIRTRSLALTDYLMQLIDQELSSFGFTVGTPRNPLRRGGHVALEHPDLAVQVNRALKARGVIPDFRPPNIIRLAPIALYTSFHDIWQVVQHIKDIMVSEEYRQFSGKRDVVG